MLLTEEEARKKECKRMFVRHQDDFIEEWTIYCSASNCMKWRWEEPPYKPERTAVHEGVVDHWVGMGYTKGEKESSRANGDWYWMEPPEPKNEKGYCGLGGKP